MELATLLQIAESYQRQQEALALRASNAVGQLWDTIVPIGDASQARFAEQASNVVRQIQAVSVRATDAYLSAVLSLEGAPPVDPVTAQEALSEVRPGIAPASVYERPSVASRAALSAGSTVAQALVIGRERATSTADIDTMMAARSAANAKMKRSSRITGYRRVTDGNACLLCRLASTQRYTIGTLMPIHNRCHCTVVPIIGSTDPGQVIDKQNLQYLKDNYKITKPNSGYVKFVAVQEHGELGPVLTKKGNDFTSEDEL